jgi:nucleoid-associated protein YgaU
MILEFVKAAGEQLSDAADAARAQQIVNAVNVVNMRITDLAIDLEGDVATVRGTAQTTAEKEVALIMVGNTEGIAQVVDEMEVVEAEPEATFYTVQKGDTLSKIAKAHFGEARRYREIFEANKPMLKDPDRIYPGQVLRIPALDNA